MFNVKLEESKKMGRVGMNKLGRGFTDKFLSESVKFFLFSFLLSLVFLAPWAAFAEDPLRPPVLFGITGLVMEDSSNSSVRYRARVGYDFKKGHYFVKSVRREYPVHENITATVFWVGEGAGPENGNISNLSSAWDENWTKNFGGVDYPDARNGYFPDGFTPLENPFYVALPYNDLDENGVRKSGALIHVYWASKHQQLDPEMSTLKNRWVKIMANGKEVFAQWEDVGPFGEDDWAYVFGRAQSANKINNSAGIDLSPAVRDYLGLSGMDKVAWQFVDYDDVPPGPWLLVTTSYGKRWQRPLAKSTFYWQLQGSLRMNMPPDTYDVDLFDNSAQKISELKVKGKKVVCYFSAGSSESWRSDFSKFPSSVQGKPLDGWPGERWLDIRSKKVRQIMLSRLDFAEAKGCDGVEPDNMDGFTNDTGFPLTYEDQLAYNRFLASQAHKRGLFVLLKNDFEQTRDLVRYFDALLMESCFENQECDYAGPFEDSLKPVFDVEYDTSLFNDKGLRAKACSAAKALGIHLYFMNDELDGSFVGTCEE